MIRPGRKSRPGFDYFNTRFIRTNRLRLLHRAATRIPLTASPSCMLDCKLYADRPIGKTAFVKVFDLGSKSVSVRQTASFYGSPRPLAEGVLGGDASRSFIISLETPSLLMVLLARTPSRDTTGEDVFVPGISTCTSPDGYQIRVTICISIRGKVYLINQNGNWVYLSESSSTPTDSPAPKLQEPGHFQLHPCSFKISFTAPTALSTPVAS